MMSLFTEVDVPLRHRSNPINDHGRWHTWSPEWRDLLRRVRKSRPRRRPRLIAVKGCDPYPQTYHLDLDEPLDADMRALLVRAAEELLAVKISASMILLTHMFEQPEDGVALRSLLALLRSTIVGIAGRPQAALYSPVQAERKKDNQFRLHADLFLVDNLMLIFDQVPADGTGRSLFLPYADLERILERVEEVPPRIRASVRQLMTGPLQTDGFNRLYDCLHGAGHPWVPALEKQLRSQQLVVPFASGEGYLLNDRFWLHGREQVSGRVGARRFHRLIVG